MASSLASIAETWPENVLPQWQQKNAYAKNKARPNNKTLGPDGIFCTKCNFLQVLDLLIFRQKQPGHWAEVVCHFHLLTECSPSQDHLLHCPQSDVARMLSVLTNDRSSSEWAGCQHQAESRVR